MQEATESRSVPVHLWIVGVLLTLWNGFGCYDYLMTRTKGAAYINEMMHTTDGDAMMAYINGFQYGSARRGASASGVVWPVRSCS